MGAYDAHRIHWTGSDGQPHGGSLSRGRARHGGIRQVPRGDAGVGTARRDRGCQRETAGGQRGDRLLQRHGRRGAQGGDVRVRRRISGCASRHDCHRHEHRKPTHVATAARSRARQGRGGARRACLGQHAASGAGTARDLRRRRRRRVPEVSADPRRPGEQGRSTSGPVAPARR